MGTFSFYRIVYSFFSADFGHFSIWFYHVRSGTNSDERHIFCCCIFVICSFSSYFVSHLFVWILIAVESNHMKSTAQYSYSTVYMLSIWAINYDLLMETKTLTRTIYGRMMCKHLSKIRIWDRRNDAIKWHIRYNLYSNGFCCLCSDSIFFHSQKSVHRFYPSFGFRTI